MMFSDNRQDLRQGYYDAWQKQLAGTALTPLETSIAQVISLHPEYHAIFAHKKNLLQDYWVEQGEINPFLHMSLHLALHEQISTDRPAGIRPLYQKLQAHFGGAHDAEHAMMECLTEAIWQAQRTQRMPDEAAYLTHLKQLLE